MLLVVFAGRRAAQAAVAALDYIDRNCDEFLEQQEQQQQQQQQQRVSEEPEEGALGPVLRRMSVDDDTAPAVDAPPGGDGAAVEQLRRQLELYRARSEIETRTLAEQHARTAAELARKTADYDELRLRLGAVEAERMLKAREAQRAAKPPPPAPQSPDDDVQDDGWEIVKDVANPTGASPPVPPPEYCVVSVVASD